jgi:ABC-type nitrate/sulfonate/bicarbonate transport system substrate-binding protein
MKVARHIVASTNETHPDALRAFIAGSLESVACMCDHKDETVKIDAAVPKIPEPIVARVYDDMLPTAPETTALDTEKFLPGTK